METRCCCRELMSIPEEEMRKWRIEAQNLITQRQAEEQRELQQLTARGLLGQPEQLPNSGRASDAAAHADMPDVMTARTRRRYQQPPAAARGAFVDDRFIPTPRGSQQPIRPVVESIGRAS